MTRIATFRTVHITPRVLDDGRKPHEQKEIAGFHYAFYEACDLFAVGDIDDLDVDQERIIKEWMFEGSLPEFATINEVKG